MEAFEELAARRHGVIARRDVPGRGPLLDSWLRSGLIVAVLPGVYARPDVAGEFATRVRAVAARYPDAVLVESTAARLTFWPEHHDDLVRVHQVRSAPRRGFAFSERRVDPAWVRRARGLRVSRPALTAVDLADSTNGESIDRVLRCTRVTPEQVRAALDAHPHRVGNALRRVLVEDSRDGAWSVAERLVHRLLRQAGITGWRANRGVDIRGSRIVPDIAFPALRVGIEVDGVAFHLNCFEEDRERQNRLVGDGWRILRLTWQMLTCDPDGVIATIKRTLAVAAR